MPAVKGIAPHEQLLKVYPFQMRNRVKENLFH
jgi:hypothetical protein